MSTALEVPLGFTPEPGSAVYKTFLESLPYYLGDEYAVTVLGDRLLIEGVPEASGGRITQAALQALATAQAEHERVSERCLHSHQGARRVREGVYESLQREGAVLPTGFGKAAYSGVVVDVFHAIDRYFTRHCLDLGARQELYPPALEGESLLRAGYFSTLAQHAYFVAPLRTRLESLQAARDGKILHESAEGHLQRPNWVMSPTVCHHCFEARRDSTIALPLKVTALNQCSRYEVHDTHGMERLRIYWMREFIQFDTDEKAVVEALDHLLAMTTETLVRWDISHQVVTANDPFFSNSATSRRAFQSMFALKRELRLPVPGGGIACASFNNHQRSLVESFNIRHPGATSGKQISSGCVGWGYDRLLFALFCQLGVDVAAWPARVRDDLAL